MIFVKNRPLTEKEIKDGFTPMLFSVRYYDRLEKRLNYLEWAVFVMGIIIAVLVQVCYYLITNCGGEL